MPPFAALDDILWRNSVSGDNAIWKSADATQGQNVGTVSDTGWQVLNQADTWLQLDGTYSV